MVRDPLSNHVPESEIWRIPYRDSLVKPSQNLELEDSLEGFLSQIKESQILEDFPSAGHVPIETGCHP